MEKTYAPHEVDPSDDLVKTVSRQLPQNSAGDIDYKTEKSLMLSVRGSVLLISASAGRLRAYSLPDGIWVEFAAFGKKTGNFLGEGSTVGDLLDVLKEKKEWEKTSPTLALGKMLSESFGNIRRKTLKAVCQYSSKENLELWKEGLSSWTEKTGLKPQTGGEITDALIVSFTKQYGRPPFTLKYPRGSFQNEIETLRPIALPLFRGDVVFLTMHREEAVSYAFSSITFGERPYVTVNLFGSGNEILSKDKSRSVSFAVPATEDYEKFLKEARNMTGSIDWKTVDLAKYHFLRSNSARESFETLTECDSRRVPFGEYALAAHLITGGQRSLYSQEKRLLLDVFQKVSTCQLRVDTVTTDRGETHKILVADLTRGKNSDGLPSRGSFVLSCDGKVPLGHYALGNIEALRERKIGSMWQKTSLRKSETALER